MRARLLPIPACRPRLVRQSAGFAMPTVMLMMVAAFAIVTVGVTASINAQHGTVRDQSSKAAFAAAEAGVAQALLDYNGGFVTSSGTPCLTPVTNPANTVQPRATQAGGTDSWCAPISGSDGSGTYSYQVCPATSAHPCAGPGTVEIVSTGTYGGVTRRVDVVAKSQVGSQVFLDAGVKSQTNITLDSNAEIHSTSAAGGNIATNSGSTKLCGTATVGPSGVATGSGYYTTNQDCTPPAVPLSSIGHQAVSLPPVNQGDAATHNDNCRITAAVTGANACGNASYKDQLTGNAITWNPNTRRLDLTGQKTALTLTGKTYSFCRLTMKSNSTLYVQATQAVSIYFDSPEACGLPAYNPGSSQTQKDTAQLYLESNTRITAQTGTALAIFFVGSQTTPTGALMSSNSDSNAACVQNFVVYAPLTDIEMNSNSTYCGAIAAKSIHLDSNARFYTDTNSQGFLLPGTAPHYVTTRFVDCPAAPASPPNAGC